MSLILAVNAGSSSLKLSLYRFASPDPVLLLTAAVASISSPPPTFSLSPAPSSPYTHSANNQPAPAVSTHAAAFAHFLTHAHIDPSAVAHVCHRIVHGGNYSDPVIIADQSFHHIEALTDLAPLHNGPALSVIKAALKALPNAQSIAFFDTAFHRTLPLHVSSYAINHTLARDKGLKKYGFHGLSYAFILRAVAKYLKKDPADLNLIILHLGSGASACAVRNGRSIDTSMGLTPVSGLPGATRAGGVDPALIFHYTSRAGRMSHDPAISKDLRITEAEDILNTKSGWKSLTGTTDFGALTARANFGGDPPNNEHLAFALFADRVQHYVGAYHLALRARVDALVFAGGIGERSAPLRATVGGAAACLGYGGVDEGRNAKAGREGEVVWDVGVRGEGEDKRILVCRTDEQLEMARECALDSRFWV